MKNKFKKLIPYIAILIVIVGLFGAAGNARADDMNGTCYYGGGDAFHKRGESVLPPISHDQCDLNSKPDGTGYYWVKTGETNPTPAVSPYQKCINEGGTPDSCKNLSGAPVTGQLGTCTVTNSSSTPPSVVPHTGRTREECNSVVKGTITATWQGDNSTVPEVMPGAGGTTTPTTGQTQLEIEITKNLCVLVHPLSGGGPTGATFWPGCFIDSAYGIFYQLPALLLTICAYIFNFMISITLTSDLFKSAFVSSAWAIVRDLSNIFFILVLLYIAAEIILDMSHDAKKMIMKVIIAALLINFSMFFTEVIIDSSNVLALIFYGKMEVNEQTKNPNGSVTTREYQSVKGEKDVAGGLVANFDPTRLLDEKFFNQTKVTTAYGQTFANTGSNVSGSVLFGIIILAGALMYFAAYCLFVAGLSFLGRLIELWILIIFSPFAFMSSSLPFLDKQEYVGWSAWWRRLLETAFMAPIFMFFLYFIFLLLSKGNPFSAYATPATSSSSLIAQVAYAATTAASSSWMAQIILTVLPTLLIMILLMKATDFAKKGSGKLGEIVIDGGKKLAGLAGGLAVGAATGGASLGLTATLGAAQGAIAGDKNLQQAAATRKGFTGWAARKTIQMADAGSKSSYDLRKAPGMGGLISKMGANAKAAKIGTRDGGFQGMAKRKSEKLEEESKLYKTKMSDDEVKDWSAKTYEKRQKEWTDRGMQGEAPKQYTTAEDLNHDRMKAFADQLGLEGLLGAISASIQRRTGGFIDSDNWRTSDEYTKEFRKNNPTGELMYDGKIASKVNNKKAKSIKMGIGATAAVLGGGVLGVPLGVAGMVAGGGIGAYGAAAYHNRDEAGEKKFAKGLDKEFKQMASIEARIKEMKELLANQTKVLADAELLKDGITVEKGTRDADGKIIEHEKDEFGNIKYEVQTEKLTRAIEELRAEEQDKKGELEAINRRIVEGGGNSRLDARKAELRGQLVDATIKIAKYNALNGIGTSMANTRNQIYNFGRRKSAIEESHEKHGGDHKPKNEGGAAHPPKATAPKPTSTPDHPPAADHPTTH